jgi:hypothetical protein
MTLATLVCWAAWSYIIWTIDPEMTNWVGFLLFYISLFLALSGTAALIGLIVRFIAFKKELAFRNVKEAFRQSFLFSALITISLILVAKDLFTWLNLFFLVIGLSILEFFLISYNKAK